MRASAQPTHTSPADTATANGTRIGHANERGLAVKAEGGVDGDHPPPFFLVGAAPFARVCTERSDERLGKRPPSLAWP